MLPVVICKEKGTKSPTKCQTCGDRLFALARKLKSELGQARRDNVDQPGLGIVQDM